VQFRLDVVNEAFPSDEYSPYKARNSSHSCWHEFDWANPAFLCQMSKEEEVRFKELLRTDAQEREQQGQQLSKKV
jgi:hypothetical protein